MLKVAKDKLQICVLGGLKKGLKTGWWMTKMMLPITLTMAILKWIGAIDLMSQWLAPLFKLFGLTAEGVLVFITACFSSLYAAIAAMATLSIDYRSATILAVMGLICHNLIVETIIQRKAGSTAWFIIVLRITTALIAALALNAILPTDYSGTLMITAANISDGTFIGALTDWGSGMLNLIPMMFCLIVALNILQAILREFNLIRYFTIPLLPLMKIFGLSRDSSFLWIVLNTLGLAYGGSVLITEVENEEIPLNEAKLLNTHAALNHSLLEDSFLFAAIGVGLFWLIVPRVLLAIIAVWIQRGFYKIKEKQWLQLSR